MQFPVYRRALSLGVGISAVLLARPVMGQQAPAAPEASHREPTADVIIVTGQPLNPALEVNVGAFGAKNPLDVPLSIESYDAAEIANRASRTLLDVLKADPSVQSASTGGNYDNLRLRGFAIDFVNTLRRDGLSLAPYQDVPFENVERIDVLKGPSGFLYGFNSPGGTINYVVKRPSRERFLTATAELTTLQGRYAAIDGSTALPDGSVGVRVNAAYEKDGDFDHARDLERVFAGAAVDIRFSDTMLLQLNGDYQWKDLVADPLLRADQSGRADPLDPASYITPPRIDRRDLLAPSWYRYKTEAFNLDARFEAKIADGWTGIVQANRSQSTRDGAFTDYFDIQPDGTIGYADLFFDPGARFRVTSVQAYMSGKFQTGGIGHEMFVGASHKIQANRWPAVFVDSSMVPIEDISVGNILDPVQPPVFDLSPLPRSDYSGRTRENSVFASDIVTLAEPVQIMLGGRYIWYRSTQGTTVYDESAFVPTVGLVLKPRRDLTLYANYARGLETGEYAPITANNAGTQSAPIRSTQYEIGAKADFGPDLNLGLAIFQIEKQAGFINSVNDFVLDGDFRHRGVEAIANGRPTPGLTLSAHLAYLDTSLQNVIDPTVLGKRTEGVPEWQGGLSADYAVPGVTGLSVNGAVQFVSNRAVDAQNSGFIDGYALVDGGLRYETALGGTPVAFRLIGKNLLNRYYYSSVFYARGLEVGRPREVTASVSVRF
jgi:iron complex outermembrane receptor protein